METLDITFGTRFKKQVRIAIVELLLYKYGESIVDFHPKKLSEQQKFDLVAEALARKKWVNYKLHESFQLLSIIKMLRERKEFSWDKVYDDAYYGDFR